MDRKVNFSIFSVFQLISNCISPDERNTIYVMNRLGHLQIGFRKFNSEVLTQSWRIYKVLQCPLGGISIGC